MSWWVTDFLVPVVTTFLGAVLGGLSAYFIAKRNYAIDKEAEGDAYLSLIIRQINIVRDKGEAVKKCIDCRDSKNVDSFLGQLDQTNKDLEYELTLLLRNWEQFSELIMLGGLTQICTDKDKRDRNEKIVAEITKMCTIITIYQTITKKFMKDYEKRQDNNLKSDDFIKGEYNNELERAANRLRDLSASAQVILEKYKCD